jgi:hypothetical protein
MLMNRSSLEFNLSVLVLSYADSLLKNSVRTVPVLSPSMRLSFPWVSVLI